MDRYDKATRSRVMAQVKKFDTKLESVLAAILAAETLTHYTKYPKELPGSPDFVFRHERVAVFLDSCFWHGCPKHCRMPRSNLGYWQTKMSKNRQRDRLQTHELRGLGWMVLRVWEHELGAAGVVARKIRRAVE